MLSFEPAYCSMSSSNYCFLICIHVSQESGQVVWYSHLLKSFPQFVMIHTVKSSSEVGETDSIYRLSHQRSPRILEWVAYRFSSGSFQPRNRTGVSCIAGGFFTSWATREAPKVTIGILVTERADLPFHLLCARQSISPKPVAQPQSNTMVHTRTLQAHTLC